jgi:hypothetical protein
MNTPKFNTVHLFSHGHERTTARYFERAIRADGYSCHYWDTVPDLSQITADDLFLFVDPAPDWPLGLERIPCRTAAYFIDVHQHLPSRLRLAAFFDVVSIAQQDYLSAFTAAGHRHVHWLPLACEPGIHTQLNEQRIFDVGFVGNLGQRGIWRNDVLTTVLPRYKTNDYHKYHAPLAMAQVYGQSKIVFNASIKHELNMRFFEALASGALLVTDRIPEALGELFTEGEHYIGYTTAAEAIEKIDYYLTHEAERLRIAAAGHQRTLTAHTYLDRWHTLLAWAEQSERTAPARQASTAELRQRYAELFIDLRQPGRIFKVVSSYGFSSTVLVSYLSSCARWVNARVPLTPNAIRYRYRARKTS